MRRAQGQRAPSLQKWPSIVFLVAGIRKSYGRQKESYRGNEEMRSRSALLKLLTTLMRRIWYNTPSYRDRWIQSIDHMFISFVRQSLFAGTKESSRGTSRKPPSWYNNSGIWYSIGFQFEYRNSNGSTSRFDCTTWRNRENENGARTSALSNSSGWLQTFARSVGKKDTREAEYSPS
jgi:hypothetical protein